MLHLSTIVGVVVAMAVVVIVIISGIVVVITVTPQLLRKLHITTKSGKIMRRNKKIEKVIRIKTIFAIDVV